MYRFPSLKHSNWLFFHEQYDSVTGKMFWWLTKKKNFDCELVEWPLICRDLYQHRWMGGPDATPNLWKQLFSAVRASGGYPGNEMFTGPLFEIKQHIFSTVLLGGFKAPWALGSFEIHWVRKYLGNLTGLVGRINATDYKTKPIITGFGHGKLS